MVESVERHREHHGSRAVDGGEGPPHQPCAALVAAVHDGVEHRLHHQPENAAGNEYPEQREVVDPEEAGIVEQVRLDLLLDLASQGRACLVFCIFLHSPPLVGPMG